VLHSSIEITALICGSKQFFRIDHGVISKMSITEQLARFAIESGPSILTDEVAAAAKLKFLDTIAVMLPGARHESGASALRVAQRMGGKSAATLLSTARKRHRHSPASSMA
jgi:2-methylcitrate dehydratase PrpD